MTNSRLKITLGLLLITIARAESVLWPCNEDADCSSVIEDAKCSKFRYCYCPAGYVFSSDVTKCLKESSNDEACSDPVQCSHMLSGAECFNGKCRCADDYFYAQGRCRKIVGLRGNCTDDVDCVYYGDRNSVECLQGRCQCAEGYYERSTNVCRRISTSEGDPCLVDKDCQGQGLTCDLSRPEGEDAPVEECRVSSPSLSGSKSHSRDIGTQFSLESSHPSVDSVRYKHLHSTSGDLNLKQSLSSYASSLQEEGKEYNAPCSNEFQPCAFKYSVCKRALCHCQLGYYYSRTRNMCLAELGEKVDDVSECGGVPNVRLQNGKCACSKNDFMTPSLRVCFKPAEFNGSCTYDVQCSPYAGYCPASSGDKRCSCRKYTLYNPNEQLCEQRVGLYQFCKTDEHCADVPNATCNREDNTCECKKDYLEREGKCEAGVGASCFETKECKVQNAECVEVNERRGPTANSNKFCTCKPGYAHIGDECLRKATKYEDECKDSEQCKPLLGDLGKCMNEKCMCDTSGKDHYRDGRCYEKTALNEPCERSSECFVNDPVDGAECRNSVCKCHVEYTPDIEQQKCIRPGRRIRKNSSNRPSPLKIVTMLLFGSAFLLTGSALKEAYYP